MKWNNFSLSDVQVDRKLVKQTVMTSVYGVTFVGARAQILNRLEEKGKESDDNQLFPASSYAAKVDLESHLLCTHSYYARIEKYRV